MADIIYLNNKPHTYTARENFFWIVEEVPGIKDYRYFIGMKTPDGNYHSEKFMSLADAKLFMKAQGIAEYKIEHFEA